MKSARPHLDLALNSAGQCFFFPSTRCRSQRRHATLRTLSVCFFFLHALTCTQGKTILPLKMKRAKCGKRIWRCRSAELCEMQLGENRNRKRLGEISQSFFPTTTITAHTHIHTPFTIRNCSQNGPWSLREAGCCSSQNVQLCFFSGQSSQI